MLLKGAKASNGVATADGVTIECTDGRIVTGSHALLAIGSIPNTDNLGLSDVGVEVIDGYVKIDHNCQSSVPHVYAAGDISGKLPLSSVASLQGRKIAEHAMGLHSGPHRHIDYEKAASAIFTEPEIADVGLAEVDAFAMGRKIRVTKVPFSANAKALIEDDARGFVKIISDPATGVVLGGAIVGRHAAELISVIALAVSAGLRVADLHESLFVHPSMAEALTDAAE
jgi:dihydrolipoamide dehydrogenase